MLTKKAHTVPLSLIANNAGWKQRPLLCSSRHRAVFTKCTRHCSRVQAPAIKPPRPRRLCHLRQSGMCVYMCVCVCVCVYMCLCAACGCCSGDQTRRKQVCCLPPPSCVILLPDSLFLPPSPFSRAISFDTVTPAPPPSLPSHFRTKPTQRWCAHSSPAHPTRRTRMACSSLTSSCRATTRASHRRFASSPTGAGGFA